MLVSSMVLIAPLGRAEHSVLESPSRRILTIMETRHECPVEYRYRQRERRTATPNPMWQELMGVKLKHLLRVS
jgi:hypothetical protein